MNCHEFRSSFFLLYSTAQPILQGCFWFFPPIHNKYTPKITLQSEKRFDIMQIEVVKGEAEHEKAKSA